MGPHPLDRPVWGALNAGQAGLTLGEGRALRLSPDYGPFGAAADGSTASLAALVELIPKNGELWLVETEAVDPPPGARVLRTAPCLQMMAQALTPATATLEITPLTEDDAPQMRALAKLTEPGPFYEHTHRLGDFIGVKHGGRLAAMAGERMRPKGFTEVSGVCTHPDHRGRGYAGGLMRIVAQAILARGETPFLHAYANNTDAIGLYETLGFAPRRMMILTVLGREPSIP